MILKDCSIFISYRRNDAVSWATALAGKLRLVFGDEAVFIDDIVSIPVGSIWPGVIQQALRKCRIFIPVIGSDWSTPTNFERLRDPADWVRQELLHASGRQSKKQLIPILLGNARLPNLEGFADDPELHHTISDLIDTQPLVLPPDNAEWDTHIAPLRDRIVELIEQSSSRELNLIRFSNSHITVARHPLEYTLVAMAASALIFLSQYYLERPPPSEGAPDADDSGIAVDNQNQLPINDPPFKPTSLSKHHEDLNSD